MRFSLHGALRRLCFACFIFVFGMGTLAPEVKAQEDEGAIELFVGGKRYKSVKEYKEKIKKEKELQKKEDSLKQAEGDQPQEADQLDTKKLEEALQSLIQQLPAGSMKGVDNLSLDGLQKYLNENHIKDPMISGENQDLISIQKMISESLTGGQENGRAPDENNLSTKDIGRVLEILGSQQKGTHSAANEKDHQSIPLHNEKTASPSTDASQP